MSAGEKRPYAVMRAWAEELCGLLMPSCGRIEIAGSIRREQPLCGDIELVAIPRWSTDGGLFGDMPRNNLTEQVANDPDLVVVQGDMQPGGQITSMKLLWTSHESTQVDLFLCRAENWGWIFTIRTGSAEFSHGLLARYKARWKIPPERPGSASGFLVTPEGHQNITLDEARVFELCGIPSVEPRDRQPDYWTTRGGR